MSHDVDDLRLPDRPQADGTFRVLCSRCGTSVSSPLTAPVVVRAWVECPACLEAHANGVAEPLRAERRRLRAALAQAATALERCAIVAGSDPEFAALAVRRYRDLLASTTEGS